MGTRAVITLEGKPIIATHWDGYPESLGKDLLGKYTLDDILRTARHKHHIDAIS